MQNIKFQKQTVVFFSLVALLALEVFVLLPASVKGLVSLNRKITVLRGQIAGVERDWPNKEKYSRQRDELKKEIEKVKAKLVSPQEESRLLSFVSTSSKDFNVEIQSMHPDKPQEFALVESIQLKYLPISLKAKSGFYELTQFLRHLQNSSYFFDVKSLSLKSGYPYNSVEALICAIVKEK